VVEDPDVGKLRTIDQEAVGLIREHNFGWKAFWYSNPEWLCLESMIDESLKNLATLRGKSASCAPSLRVLLPWHLPYN
jgi:hypothetical protein